jgi:uncharacterized LabA/DUF88 family protein
MRVAFIIDGFNLYHSLKAAQKRDNGSSLRWLDVYALCATLVKSAFGPGSTVGGVYYFSAYASHLESRNPAVTKRHRTYVEALKATGVHVSMGKFKRKVRAEWLHRCRIGFRLWPWRSRLPFSWVRISFTTHEEKETDVAIAAKLFELLHNKSCDAVVLVTGDTDVAPALRTAQKLFPQALIMAAFPYLRHNNELARIAARTISLSLQLYQSHILPQTITLPNGRQISKPAKW